MEHFGHFCDIPASESPQRQQGCAVRGFEIVTLRLFLINGWRLWLVEVAVWRKTSNPRLS